MARAKYQVQERKTMKSATPAIFSYLNGLRADHDALGIFADCFTFTLQSGMVLTYTNADLPVTWNGYVYLANSVRVEGLRYKSSVGLEVDQQHITIAALQTDTLSSGVPFLQALSSGTFDGCLIKRERVFLNSWSAADLASPIGSVVMFAGRIGAVEKIGRTEAQITVNSDLVLLDMPMPRNVYSPFCQHVLYDSGCALSKAAYAYPGAISGTSNLSYIAWTDVTNNFLQGTITFASGSNNGISANIKSVNPGMGLGLSSPLPAWPNIGDTFTAYCGCDHTATTCQNRFNNLANFRGFPYVPQPTYTLF